MADTNSTQSENTTAANSTHEPYRWLNKEAQGFPGADFVELAMEVSNGIRTCLELVNASDLARDENETPLLDKADTCYLLRLAIVSSKMLAEDAEQKLAWISKHGANYLDKRMYRRKQ